MRLLFLIVLLLLLGCDDASSTHRSAAPRTPQTTAPNLIDFEVINREESGTIKMAYDVRVGLVNGRLPSENELAAVSQHLRQGDGRRHNRTFVLFYLPDMEIGEGAFATAHHTPDLSVAFYPFHLPEEYRRLLPQQEPSPPTPSSDPGELNQLPDNIEISVTATQLDRSTVELLIQTNIPLPVEVMAGVSLKGQKPDDTYIGHTKRVRLTTPEQRFLLDIGNTRRPLPDGEYIAEVTFYPRWGAKDGNRIAQLITDQIEGTADIQLKGSGRSVSEEQARNEAQRWVMETVVSGMSWNEREFVQRLGTYQTLDAEIALHTAYYFPTADITILVNTHRGTITTWRMGRQTR